MECIWLAETGFGSHPDHKRSRPPSSTVLVVLSTVSARAGNRSVRVSWHVRFTRVRSNNLSTQLRRTRTSSTVSPPVPTTVADPNKRQIRSKYEWRRLHSTQRRKRHEIYRKSKFLNGEHFYSLRVSIASCGLTSISAIAATAFDKSCKWPI